VTKLGVASQLQRRDERASQLYDLRYVARVLAQASENKNKDVDRKAQNRRQSAVSVAAKKAQAADRAASSRKKTFDDETRDAVTTESNPAVSLLQAFDVAAFITTGSSNVDKGGAFLKELRAKEIEARRPGHVTPRNKTTGEPAASALELLFAESAALEIKRLDPTKVIARDDKGKPTAAIAELTKKLSDLKGGKAHLERLTGFDGEQK
jgi:flagellar motor protein MotB